MIRFFKNYSEFEIWLDDEFRNDKEDLYSIERFVFDRKKILQNIDQYNENYDEKLRELMKVKEKLILKYGPDFFKQFKVFKGTAFRNLMIGSAYRDYNELFDLLGTFEKEEGKIIVDAYFKALICNEMNKYEAGLANETEINELKEILKKSLKHDELMSLC